MNTFIYSVVVDAWGKPGTGLLTGNFKWIGEVNECIKVKADRRRVEPGGTLIVQKDAIRGAWSLVTIGGGFLKSFVSL